MPSRTHRSTRTGWMGVRNGRHRTYGPPWGHGCDGSDRPDGFSLDTSWAHGLHGLNRPHRLDGHHRLDGPHWVHRLDRFNGPYRLDGLHGDVG